MSKGAEVAGTVVFLQAGEGEARERIVQWQANQKEALVVTEADVVARTEFLDEFAFKEERFGFVADEVEVKVPDAVDEGACLSIRQLGAGWREVIGEALAEVAGFANIDDPIESVPHDVNSRLVRDVTETGTQIGFFAGDHDLRMWG